MWKSGSRGALLIPLLLGAALLTACGLLPSNQSPTEVPTESYTVTVQPGQSIQEAIDAAPAGAVILLSEGEWEENLEITKDLTLKGAGPGKTVIKNPGCRDPVLWIRNGYNEHHVEVSIEDMMISSAIEHCNVNIAGRNRGRLHPQVPVPLPSPPAGIEIDGGADVKLKNLLIFRNPGVGISGGYGSTLAIEDSWIAENGSDGIETPGSMVIKDSLILNNAGNGITAYSNLYMEGCAVKGNEGDGISLVKSIALWYENTAHGVFELMQNTITANGGNGIKVYVYVYTEPPPIPSSMSSNTLLLDIYMTLDCNSIVGNKGHGVDCEEMFKEGFVFTGAIKGADNEISGNGRIDIEPGDLRFLTTPEGECYGPGCGTDP